MKKVELDGLNNIYIYERTKGKFNLVGVARSSSYPGFEMTKLHCITLESQDHRFSRGVSHITVT